MYDIFAAFCSNIFVISASTSWVRGFKNLNLSSDSKRHEMRCFLDLSRRFERNNTTSSKVSTDRIGWDLSKTTSKTKAHKGSDEKDHSVLRSIPSSPARAVSASRPSQGQDDSFVGRGCFGWADVWERTASPKKMHEVAARVRLGSQNRESNS